MRIRPIARVGRYAALLALIIALAVGGSGCAHNEIAGTPVAPGHAYITPGRPRPTEREFARSPQADKAPEARWEQREASLLGTMGDEQKEVPAARRVVVYTAGYRLVVQDVTASLQSMEAIARETGGYVQEVKGDSSTIRVPVAQYQDAIQRVEALGQVVDRELQAQDVTEEYVDLEARLRNAQKVRARLEGLLEKATTVEETLKVEKELGRIGEEIERLTGKLELLKNRVAYSTITARFERVARQSEAIKGLRQLPFYWLHELDPNRLFGGY